MRCLWDSLFSKNLNCFSVIFGDSFNMPLDWSSLLGATAVRNNLVVAKSLARIGRNWIELFSVKVIPKATSTATEFWKWKSTAKIQFVIKEYSFPAYKKYSWLDVHCGSHEERPQKARRELVHMCIWGARRALALFLSLLPSLYLFSQEIHSRRTKDHFQLPWIAKLDSP